MYLTALKTLLTDAVRQTFDSDYPRPQFRNLHASIEFPDDRQHYPGVWVDFEPQGDLERVGVGHLEEDSTFDGTAGRQFTRWRFQGHVTYTLAALSSLERDTLYDEMIRVLAFGQENETTSEFRSYIENNDLIDCNFNFDQISTRGSAVSPGTPWGTEEFIYETTIAVEVLGEFVSDSVTATLLPVTSIVVTEYPKGQPDPDPSW